MGAFASLENQSFPARRVSKIGCGLDPPIDRIAEAPQGANERAKRFSFMAGIGAIRLKVASLIPQRLGQQWPPVLKLLDVFHEDVLHVDVSSPADKLPGLRARLFLAGTAASGVAVKPTFTGSGQEIEGAGFDEVERMDVLNALTEMSDERVIKTVRVNRRLPVVDGNQVNAAMQALGDSFDNSRTCAAGAAEQVNYVEWGKLGHV